jgi:hypothetical protein
MGFNHRINKGEFITQLKLQKVMKTIENSQEKPDQKIVVIKDPNNIPLLQPENLDKIPEDMVFTYYQIVQTTQQKFYEEVQKNQEKILNEKIQKETESLNKNKEKILIDSSNIK